MEEEIKLPLNKEMSDKYGLTIYDAENEQFPYFVQEWDECFTEDEIREYRREDLDFANIDTEQERAIEMPWDYGKHFD